MGTYIHARFLLHSVDWNKSLFLYYFHISVVSASVGIEIGRYCVVL